MKNRQRLRNKKYREMKKVEKMNKAKEMKKCEEADIHDFYTSMDDEYRRKFSYFTGQNTYDTGYSVFTHEQMVKKYSSALIFWKLELDRLSRMELALDPKLIIRHTFVSYKYREIVERARSKFRFVDNFPEFLKKLEDIGMQYYHMLSTITNPFPVE